MFTLKKICSYSAIMFLLPAVTLAEDVKDLKSLISYVMEILNALIPLFFALAFIAFIWGIIKYLYAAGPQKLSEARNYIVFGIIAMTVMLSVWGIAKLIKDSFFESTPAPVDVQETQLFDTGD